MDLLVLSSSVDLQATMGKIRGVCLGPTAGLLRGQVRGKGKLEEDDEEDEVAGRSSPACS